MKITLTGSLGNISKPLAQILIEAGHEITIISSNPSKAGDIESLGARPAIGSVADINFLTKAFRGSDIVYTMVPPNWEVSNYREYIAQTGRNYRDAISLSGVKRVINLSSVGAHLSEGTGPIAGLYDVEQILNTLDTVAIKHLRAGIFYINFLFDIPVIKNMGIMGNNYHEDNQLVMVHPRDIAAKVAWEINNSFEGNSYSYVASSKHDISTIVKVLGTAIDQPNLPWVEFTDEQTFAGMTAAGMSEAIANTYVEMGNAISSGILFEDFQMLQSGDWGKTTLEDFAREFATIYQSPVD